LGLHDALGNRQADEVVAAAASTAMFPNNNVHLRDGIMT